MVATFDPNTAIGLSELNAIARLKDDGYNELPSAESRNLLSIAWNSIQDPIFLLLVGGGIVYWWFRDRELLELRRSALKQKWAK